MHRYKAFFAATLLSLGAVACGGGKIPPTRYYALELPAAPAPRAAGQGFSAAVMPFRAERMLNQDRIVYRPTRQEVGYYEYHRWAEDPRSAITSAIIDRLRASGAFKSVALYDGRTRADFVLRGRIEQLEEVDYDAGVKAAASISAELLDASNQRVVWESSASAMRDVTTSEVSAVVEQLTAAVDEAVTKLSGEIAEHVQSAEPVSE